MRFKPNFDQLEEMPDSLGMTEKPVSSEKIKEIFEKIDVPKDSWATENFDEYVELLQKELSPQSKLTIEGREMYLSELVKSDHDRDFAIAYIENEERKYIPRTFFLSRSQGAWRAMIGYTKDDDGKVDWHHKGKSQDSLMLPTALQKKMSAGRDMTNENIKIVDKKLMYGALEVINDREDLPEEYYSNIDKEGLQLSDQEYGTKGGILSPEDVHINQEYQPNFSHVVAQWSYKNPMYGGVLVRVISSNDESLRYVISRNTEGKVWVSGVENAKSNITDIGIRKEWVRGGIIVMPAYEYSKRESLQNYYDESDEFRHDRSKYYDVYRKYLSKTPLIKAFNQEMGYKNGDE